MNTAHFGTGAREFVRSFAICFVKGAIWGFRFGVALGSFLVGVVCVGLLTETDAQLHETLRSFPLNAQRQAARTGPNPLIPKERVHGPAVSEPRAARPIRIALVVLALMAFGLCEVASPFKTKQSKAARNKAEIERAASDAELSEIRAQAAMLEQICEHFALVFTVPAVRRAVLHAIHPDKAATDTERAYYTHVCQVANQLFDQLESRGA